MTLLIREAGASSDLGVFSRVIRIVVLVPTQNGYAPARLSACHRRARRQWLISLIAEAVGQGMIKESFGTDTLAITATVFGLEYTATGKCYGIGRLETGGWQDNQITLLKEKTQHGGNGWPRRWSRNNKYSVPRIITAYRKTIDVSRQKTKGPTCLFTPWLGC